MHVIIEVKLNDVTVKQAIAIIRQLQADASNIGNEYEVKTKTSIRLEGEYEQAE